MACEIPSSVYSGRNRSGFLPDSLSDLFQLGKTGEHFFHADFVKVYRHFVVSAAVCDIFYDTDSEFHMTDRVSLTIVQACLLYTSSLFCFFQFCHLYYQ